ncbi:MAG TPA: Calx-beta domain-containing protein [Pyrinomonadaceae bacterium]|jgi:hypothetical protein
MPPHAPRLRTLAGACLLLCLSHLAAHAATITVNSLAGWAAPDGQCSLSEAITAAETDAAADGCAAGAGDDTITFAVTGTVNLALPLPALHTRVTIQGPGTALLTVRRPLNGGAYGIFDVREGAAVHISGLTASGGSGFGGGGVLNAGTLTLAAVVITGNSVDTFPGSGGGILNRGVLTLAGSTVSGNRASFGAGISNSGTLLVISSTLSGNSASFGAAVSNSGTLTVLNSTISGNSAFSQAIRTGDGAGISNSGTLLVRSSTITNNSCRLGPCGISHTSPLPFTLVNTIVAGNTAAPGIGPPFSFESNLSGVADPAESSFNLIGPGGGGGLADGVNGNQVGVADPRLGPLADNGGPTRTHAPLPGSPAVDKGGNPGAAADQRGFARPADDPTIPNAGAPGADGSDIGAVEALFFAVSDVTAAEGNSGLKPFVFNVTLSGPSNQTVTVDYATADGTANSPADFLPALGTLVFTPGETLKTVTVNVFGDTAPEPDETFLFNLLNPSGHVVIVDAQGRGTITNDDAGPTPTPTPTPAGGVLEFGQAAYGANEDCTAAVVNVRRTGDAGASVSVAYSTSDGTANSRSDYSAAAGTLSFAPGQTEATFVVLISEDTRSEGPETLNVALTNSSGGAALGPRAQAVLTIADDDPSASSANANDDTASFVCQHYHDFLNREPDAAGLTFWTNNIESCGANTVCRELRRIDTSAAFFLSIEFQETGYLAYRAYGAAFGTARVGSTVPLTLAEFLPDVQRLGRNVVVGAPGWEAQLAANKAAYFDEFVSRAAFAGAHPPGAPPAQYVDALNANAGGALSAAERDRLVSELTAGTKTRAQVLRAVAEDPDFGAAQFNRAFVLMEYFGYLRRNPNDPPDADYSGFNFWLSKLNQFGGDYRRAEMVKAFISSAEYRARFGP